MTGNVRIGVTVQGSASPNVDIRVMHISRGRPLISAEQEPHLPALQFHRTARSGVCVACNRWMRSRTSSPASPSPRHPRNCAWYPISVLLSVVGFEFLRRVVLLQLAVLEEVEQV